MGAASGDPMLVLRQRGRRESGEAEGEREADDIAESVRHGGILLKNDEDAALRHCKESPHNYTGIRAARWKRAGNACVY